MLVAHVTYMLYECWSNKHVEHACCMRGVIQYVHISQYVGKVITYNDIHLSIDPMYLKVLV